MGDVRCDELRRDMWVEYNTKFGVKAGCRV